MKPRVGVAVGVLLAVVLCGATLAPAPFAGAGAALASSDQALVIADPDADLDAVADAIRESGGRVTHTFPPAALIVEGGGKLPSDAGVRAVYQHEVGPIAMASLRGAARRAARVWNQLLAPATSPDTQTLDALQADLVGDALTSSSPSILTTASVEDADAASLPGFKQTSEFFIGSVAVGIVLPQSDGSIEPSTEEWTDEERTTVISEIVAALDWWAAREPRATLSFVYDDNGGQPISTGYEPINQPYTDEHTWITDVMERKGYTGSSYFEQVYAYNNVLREAYGTDWAFTIFVVDSSEDDDDRFPDGIFAYAYTGGPFAVLTSGNAGYGIENLDSVVAHEVGHIFYALDQHEGARKDCTRRSGYLDVENQNSLYGDCTSDEPSIMRSHIEPYAAGAVDPYARGQVGWRDSDGDGILDPVDTTILLSDVEVVTDPTDASIYTITGDLEEQPYPSPSRPSVTINTIESVHYRVGSGDWIAAEPTDGAFDAFRESFHATTDSLPTGEFDVDVRAVDSAGNVHVETLATISPVNPVDEILDTTLMHTALQSVESTAETVPYRGQATSRVSYVAGTYYRVDQGDWNLVTPDDGAFDEPEESFSFTVALDELSAGTHEIQVYSIDGAGNVEPTPAIAIFSGGLRQVRVFFPLMMKGR